MALVLKDLGTGQLPAVKGTLYTCPGATQAAAKVSIVNASGAQRTINIYVQKDGANSRRISSVDQKVASGARAEFAVQTLEAGDLIEGDADAATSVDYVINGFEVS